ncbi:uncharacterized protein CCR75_000099 [Bremia lactucae]|uniref:Uncharacterized protein n=1 Tax=Bremia lactucae TaxID=4779 RepID=A0A976II84_BRELC|nr:hypothetical protein CCR75_000099 [Bremia lactucae]
MIAETGQYLARLERLRLHHSCLGLVRFHLIMDGPSECLGLRCLLLRNSLLCVQLLDVRKGVEVQLLYRRTLHLCFDLGLLRSDSVVLRLNHRVGLLRRWLLIVSFQA